MSRHHSIAWQALPVGSHRLSCPACGRERRNDKTLGVTIDAAGAGVAHCFRCTFVETYRPDDRAHRNSHHQRHQPQHQPAHRRPEPVRVAVQSPVQHERLSAAGLGLWRASHPIAPGTPPAHYLNMRHCVLPPISGHLRWLPAHRHPSGHVGPCLVALLTDAISGEPRSLHFTWIAGGKKADVNPPRLLLKGHRKAGAVCRLWPDEFVTHGLAVAEGIESALSLAHGYTPVWSSIDAGNLSAFPVLAGVEVLVIAQDRDPTGEKAAAACAGRWAAAGRAVLVTQQAVGDLNDVVNALGVKP
jgi:phage/plasmid primase-like uncharacterized protein